jgi:hypothetical protein
MEVIPARLPDSKGRHKGRSRVSRDIKEHKSKPDFIFPGIAEYHDPHFDLNKLTMLGVKTTCSDRWRQVLAEADRIRKLPRQGDSV